MITKFALCLAHTHFLARNAVLYVAATVRCRSLWVIRRTLARYGILFHITCQCASLDLRTAEVLSHCKVSDVSAEVDCMHLKELSIQVCTVNLCASFHQHVVQALQHSTCYSSALSAFWLSQKGKPNLSPNFQCLFGQLSCPYLLTSGCWWCTSSGHQTKSLLWRQ